MTKGFDRRRWESTYRIYLRWLSQIKANAVAPMSLVGNQAKPLSKQSLVVCDNRKTQTQGVTMTTTFKHVPVVFTNERPLPIQIRKSCPELVIIRRQTLRIERAIFNLI